MAEAAQYFVRGAHMPSLRVDELLVDKPMDMIPLTPLHPYEEFMIAGGMCLINGCILSLSVSAILATTHMLFVSPSLFSAIPILLMFLLCTLPVNIHTWPWILEPHWMWRGLWRYFSFKVVIPDTGISELATSRCILAEFPHGVFPMGQVLGQPVLSSLLSSMQIRHVRYIKGGAASIVFRVPFLRQIYSWCGVIPANKERLFSQIQRYNVGLIPGGIAEMCISDPTIERVFLKRRKGFIRLAISSGASLVPVYHFGNTQILHHAKFFQSNWCRAVSRYLRFAIFYPVGRFWLPAPRRHPIVMAIGQPIHVKHVSIPSPQYIDEVHEQFTAALQLLFESNKHLVGWEHKQLEIH